MEVRSILRGITRRWQTLTAITLLCLLLAGAIIILLPVRYEAETTLFVSTGTTSGGQDLYSGGSFARDRVKSYAQAIPMPVVLEPVIDEMGLGVSADELAEKVTTSVPLDSVLIEIRVTDEDPSQAARIANAIADEFRDLVPRLEDPENRSDSPVSVSVLRRATPPQTQASPDVLRILAVALVIGLGLGVLVTAILEQTDTRIRTEEQVRDTLDLAVLGTLSVTPKNMDALVVAAQPMGQRAEAYRSLRSNLQFFSTDRSLKTFSITSARPGEGKSTIAANLALAMSETDERVCLVEADLRKPRVLSYLGLEGAAGLTNVLIGEVTLDDVLQPYGRNLSVLGAGRLPPNPSELLGSQAMHQLLAELATRFDRVILDTPPLLPVTDGAVVARMADGVCLVIGANLADENDVRRCVEILDRSQAHLLGAVLNRMPEKTTTPYGDADGYLSERVVEDQPLPKRVMPRKAH